MMKVISRKLVRKAIEMINNLAKVDDSDDDVLLINCYTFLG